MNSDFSQLPPDERELRLTALLLGELSPVEAEEVHRALAADSELARAHARLRQTIELVRASTTLDRGVSAGGVPLRLDNARRNKLLAAFQTPAPRAVPPRRRWSKWFVPMSAAAVLIGLLVVVTALPMFVKARAGADRVTALPLGAFHGEQGMNLESLTAPTKLGLDLIALPSPADSLEDNRRQISGQLQSSGFLAVNDPMFNLADAERGVKTAVPDAAGSVALNYNYSTKGYAGGPAPPPATADGLSGPTITTTSGRQSVVRAPDQFAVTTDRAADFTAEFRELPNSGGGASYAGVGIAPGGGVSAGRGGGQNLRGSTSGAGNAAQNLAEARMREIKSKQVLLGVESEWMAATTPKPPLAVGTTSMNMKQDEARDPGFGRFAGGVSGGLPVGAANGSDFDLVKLGDVTDTSAAFHINGAAVQGNVIPSGQPEAKDAKRIAGDSSTWKSAGYTAGLAAGTKDGPINASGAEEFFSKLTRADGVEERFGFQKAEPQPSGDTRAWFGNSLNTAANREAGGAGWEAAANRPALALGFYDDNVNLGLKTPPDKTGGDLNDNVAIQLPGLAAEEPLGRQSSPTRRFRVDGRSGLGADGEGAIDPAGLPGTLEIVAQNEKLAVDVLGEAKAQVEARRTLLRPLPAPAKIPPALAGEPVEKPLTQAVITNGGPQVSFANASPSVGLRTLDGSLPQTTTPEKKADLKQTEENQSLHLIQGRDGAEAAKRTLSTTSSFARTNAFGSRVEPEAPPRPSAPAPTPQSEVLTRENAFSTFSLNVSDVSFKLAAASLEQGARPEVATIRSEEFLNAFDYRDPVPAAGVPVAFAWERARYPFAHNREALRFSVKTAAQGRENGKPLNIVLLLDNSGSMERADRVRIIQESLRALAAQLQPQDRLSVVTFARTPRLWADGVTGAQAAEVVKQIGTLTPEGGTNLEDALDLAYRTALRHYAATAVNRVVLLTDGAANLGNIEPKALQAKVEAFRQQGVALDCFGIGWDGFNDDLLEQLSRHGDGRYGFVNTPEEAATEFVGQLAGALRVAASDVKVQVEFNPRRVTAYRQIGYAKHQLTKQQFRDNTVDAAEIGAAEAGNGLYIIETNPRGEGPIATVRARFRIPQTSDYREHEWVVPFGSAVDLEQSSSAMRLATSASAFSEWLAGSPFAGEVTPDRLLGLMSGVPEVYGADPRPKKLEWMIRQAKSISGK